VRARWWGPGAKVRGIASPQPDTRRAEGRASVVRCFDAWREAAYDVEAASRWWRTAPAEDWEAAASGFFAALEREEKAASEYERAWRAWRAWRPARHLSLAGR
jgi:class 3 adenylate cyclase